MRLDGIKVTIGIDTIREWLQKKEKRKLQVGELVEIKGFQYRIYDVDDEGFKAHEEKA